MPPHAPYPTIFLELLHKDGAAGVTYRSTCGKFIVKTSLPNSASCDMLKKESDAYDKLHKLAQDFRYANNYGIFHLGEKGLALVLSYEGEPVFFKSLSNDDR